MTNKNIENIYFNNNGISALYQGTNLIWKKQEVVTDGYIIGYANTPPNLSYSPLTADSAMVFINGLEEVTETKTLSLKDTTYDSLTEEQIAIATSKGWTVTRS